VILSQLHNPYLAAPLSIEAYRMATPSSDHHRKTVIEWLDRLQSSVRSPPVRSGPVKNPFQLDTRTDESEESDDEQTQQAHWQHVQLRRALSGLDDSPNTLVVESDIDAYAYDAYADFAYVDDAVPIRLLENLAISSSKDSPAVSAEKKGGENAGDDDLVRSLCWLHGRFHRESRIRLTRHFFTFVDRESPLGTFSCPARHGTSPCASL
jgi:hypothetical protein